MITFSCTGHENVLATHKTTFEFTNDSFLTKQGDCIVGINANFTEGDIKKILNFDKIEINLKSNTYTDSIKCTVNKDFNDKHEIVIRTTDFLSKRTLGIHANKSSKDLNRDLIENLKNPDSILTITIKELK